jgi:hypothetical protein
MTNALDAVTADGHRDAISREALAGLSPTRPSTSTASATTFSTSASRPRHCPSRSRQGHSRRARRPHLPRQSLCEILARIVAMVQDNLLSRDPGAVHGQLLAGLVVAGASITVALALAVDDG